ncbi:hypothetical protein [Mycobacteroides abscessus]|uniref:hypothetical protein n=1 Tax=Mycobacteroides abscessus TaxID=36809 RepID=UPI00092A1326|nr:hypothetical protein [Mycobacteroides abscessus]SIE16150.1 Uncharacterised protein [Mycobacteroides abscessus subsp. abscessus]SLC73549.1 Uncharacterised protein [Mycobacteroides abscessus subsp. massiliense]SLI83687.1 Uncharacterised protein [Mycobacteroides abscessus subsp. abscessus]
MTVSLSRPAAGRVKLTEAGTTTADAYCDFLCVKCGVKRYRPAGVMCEECFQSSRGLSGEPAEKTAQIQVFKTNHQRKRGTIK